MFHIFRNLLQLITIRQFPPADKSLPPLNKSKWWIPTATKVRIISTIVTIQAQVQSPKFKSKVQIRMQQNYSDLLSLALDCDIIETDLIF